MVIEHQADPESAIVVLNPPESKRLIAKAVAVLPEVKRALEKGTLIISQGTTNAYVAEEILGVKVIQASDYASHAISEGELSATHPDANMSPYVVKDGKIIDKPQWLALRNFRPGDVFIKGANAVDPKRDVGVLTAAHDGASIASAWYAITGVKAHFVCPVGLEKLIPSVEEASRKCHLFRFKYSTGLPVSLLRFRGAKVITEIEAISALTGATAIHVASGGIGGSEGAVVLALEAEAEILDRAFRLVVSVKGESPLPAPRQYAAQSAASLGYDAAALSESCQFTARDPRIYRP